MRGLQPSRPRLILRARFTWVNIVSTAASCVLISMPPMQSRHLVAEALGWSRGGFSAKFHLRGEGPGDPMMLIPTPRQTARVSGLYALDARRAIKRGGPGCAKYRPKRASGDKGYTSAHTRQHLRQHRLRCTIPRPRCQRRGSIFGRRLHRSRNQVERLINSLRHLPRLAAR